MSQPIELSDASAHHPRLLEIFAEHEREKLGEQLERAESCHSLWTSVVELALRDLAYIEEKKGEPNLSSHERSKLNRILEHDPKEFISDEWFDQICDYLGVSADKVRDRAGDASTHPRRRRHIPRPAPPREARESKAS